MDTDWKEFCDRVMKLIKAGFESSQDNDAFLQWEKDIKAIITEYDRIAG